LLRGIDQRSPSGRLFSFSETGSLLLVFDEALEVEVGHAHDGVTFRAQAPLLLAHFYLQRTRNLAKKAAILKDKK